jgi:D-3-phosphoglycerate dehydrogenase
VADVALAYVIGLARDLFAIDRGTRAGEWPKPRGISLAERNVALVGFGDVGRQLARRLLVLGMHVVAYDPDFTPSPRLGDVVPAHWPERLAEADFVVLACASTPENRHLIDRKALSRMKRGVRIVNVARGALIDERALAEALDSGRVHSAALDVFEAEPLPCASELRRFGERLVLGSHNASNTREGVERASRRAIRLLFQMLEA